MNQPNCYNCRHRRRIAGNEHSRCVVPLQTGLRVEGNAVAQRSGWFFWPFNFDPAWLTACNGFEAIQGAALGAQPQP